MEPQTTPTNQSSNNANMPPASHRKSGLLILILAIILLGAGWFYFSKIQKFGKVSQVYEEVPYLSGHREQITIENKGNLGIATTLGGDQYLVDKEGMTLYYNTADEGQRSASIRWSCGANCENTWLPYLVDEESLALTQSADPLLKNLNTFERSWDSRRQYALQTKLLYRYRGDQVPGDMQGDSWGGGWMVARP